LCETTGRRCALCDAALNGADRGRARKTCADTGSVSKLLVRVYLRVFGREEKCHHLDLDGPGRPPGLRPQCGRWSVPAAPVGRELQGVRAELLLGWVISC
jgi:hypothetical protein